MSRLCALLSCCALAAACTATETGNPVAEQHMALTAHSSSDRVALAQSDEPAQEGRIQVSEAWVVLGDIRFVRSTACDEGSAQQVDVPGPTVAELVAQPEVLEFAAEEARYCRVRVPLERADEDDAGIPRELADAAILVRGISDAGTPFLIRSRRTREVDLRSRGEPFGLAQANAGLILAFDVARWLSGVDLDRAAVQGGEIVIDDDHERALLERFEENVEAAMELFRDHDDDQELDDAEAQNPLASGG